MALQINIDKEAFTEFCEEAGITRLAFYGSVLKDTFREDSDIDILIDFGESVPEGSWRLGILEELEDMLGKRIDAHYFEGVEKSENIRISEHILSEAEVYYDSR